MRRGAGRVVSSSSNSNRGFLSAHVYGWEDGGYRGVRLVGCLQGFSKQGSVVWAGLLCVSQDAGFCGMPPQLGFAV